MQDGSATPLRWARNAAILALVLSMAALFAPSELSGYNDWGEPSLVIHNLAAIATRIVIVALVAGAFGELWRRSHRRHGAARHRSGPKHASRG